MEIIHTRNRAVAWGVLLSALVVGVVLTLGQVPLAVSQPVTIQAKMIKGPIPMDGANPLWENVPGVVVPLTGQTITTPMHPNIAVKSVFVKAVTNGKDIGIRLDWGDQSKTIRLSARSISVTRRPFSSRSTPAAPRPSSAWGSRAAR